MPSISKVIDFPILEKEEDGQYIKKHPETKGSQVILSDGTTVEEFIQYVTEERKQDKHRLRWNYVRF